jgi:hypothetical protein
MEIRPRLFACILLEGAGRYCRRLPHCASGSDETTRTWWLGNAYRRIERAEDGYDSQHVLFRHITPQILLCIRIVIDPRCQPLQVIFVVVETLQHIQAVGSLNIECATADAFPKWGMTKVYQKTTPLSSGFCKQGIKYPLTFSSFWGCIQLGQSTPETYFAAWN